MTTIGVISDTHGLLRETAIEKLKGSDRIIHAGDVGSPDILDRLQSIAPVVAVRGNIDKDPWGAQLPHDEVIEIEGKYIYTLHDLGELDLVPAAAGFDVIVTGHTHIPKITTEDGVLHLNPGSAGPRRFRLPITLARLTITREEINADILMLEEDSN